jgi:dTDP-4-dehydrorhamnose 3,5-epimerase
MLPAKPEGILSMVDGAKKDRQSATAEGQLTQDLLEGVRLKEVPNLITRNGITTELYRPEWPVGPDQVRHMIHVILRGDALSAWHMHEKQTDTFFVTDGTIKVILFDDRPGSPTQGKGNVFHLSRMRPTLVTVPPGIWHGLKNLEKTQSGFINYFDRPYDYADPDEWRLPPDTEKIPFRF